MAQTGTLSLADEHRKVLETIYGVLLREGRWPSYQYLERIFDLTFDLDLEEISKTIPDWLTTLPRPPYPAHPTQEIAITIAGLQYCPQASTDVALVFRVFQGMVELEKTLIPSSIDAIPMPCLATDELVNVWSVDLSDLKRAFQIAAREPWANGLSSIRNDALQICANRNLKPFRKAKTLEDYLELRDAWYAPLRRTSVPVPPRDDPMGWGSVPRAASVTPAQRERDKEWDIFIAHASADKETLVRPLAAALQLAGLKVWLDELELTVGDSLRRKIDEGLLQSRFGVVILSPSFFEREWPQTELDGLAQKEIDGRKVILPVWHRTTAEQVRAKSPMLAGRVSVSSDRGITHVVKELLRAMGRRGDADKPTTDEPSGVADPTTEQPRDVADPIPEEPGDVAGSTTDPPINGYRETVRLLREQNVAAAKKRARVLGGQLRKSVSDWMDSNPTVPTTISTKPELASWEPVFGPLLDAVGNSFRAFVSTATAAVESDDDALGSFAHELVSLFRVEGKSSGPEGGAAQLVARLGSEMLLGRAFALGRWQELIDIARPKVSDSNRVDNWVFFNSFIHPRFFGSDGRWPGVLVMDLLAKDALNDELGLTSEKASDAAAEANMLLGVVNYAKRQRNNRDIPYTWGFAGTGPREVVHTVLANDHLVDLLAEFAGEPAGEFRLRFSVRFQQLFRAANRDNWAVTLFDETVTLLDEISRTGQANSERRPS